MSAEEQIRRTMALYIRAHDTLDVQGMVSLFADEGFLANATGEYAGQSAIRQFYESWRGAWPPGRLGKLLCANTIIAVHGGTAEALTDVISFQRDSSDSAWRVNSVAQYADKFARIQGKWFFTEKRAVSAGSLPPGSEWAELVDPDARA